ncbi:MAG: hypothetical protein IJN96_02955 [Clostridia bacterium]|nr:hypothetical protein [Clostridia bacterium]
MALNYSFIDGVVYGTEDINKITSDIVGEGIWAFAEKESYNVSDFNELTENLVESGVQLGGCRCSLSGTGTLQMTVLVEPGVVFFDSGVKLTVDDEGYSIPIENNTAGYVYAHYSPSLQTADIVFGEQPEDNGEVVMLARISDSGVISDIRRFASSKVVTLGKNSTVTLDFQRMDELAEHNGRYIMSVIGGVDISRYNYAIVTASSWHGDSHQVYFPEVGYYTAFFNLTDERQSLVLYNNGEKIYEQGTSFFYRTNRGYCYYIEVVGGELCITCECDRAAAAESIKDAYGTTVCLL